MFSFNVYLWGIVESVRPRARARARASANCFKLSSDKFTNNFAFRYTLLNPSLCFAINVVSRDNVMTFRFPRNWKLLPHEQHPSLNGLGDCNLNTLCNVNYSAIDWQAYRFCRRLKCRDGLDLEAIFKAAPGHVRNATRSTSQCRVRRKWNRLRLVCDRGTFAESLGRDLKFTSSTSYALPGDKAAKGGEAGAGGRGGEG